MSLLDRLYKSLVLCIEICFRTVYCCSKRAIITNHSMFILHRGADSRAPSSHILGIDHLSHTTTETGMNLLLVAVPVGLVWFPSSLLMEAIQRGCGLLAPPALPEVDMSDRVVIVTGANTGKLPFYTTVQGTVSHQKGVVWTCVVLS